jgi:protein-L-isoaspartate(D-aspartate) O-methyltransferase
MGYLHETLAALRKGRSATDMPPAWGEDSRDAWLIAMPGDFSVQRGAMVAALRTRLGALADRLDQGAIDRALHAMAIVPRERFVCPMVDDLAYLPAPIDIGQQQIMSHPELVAVLAAAADPRGGAVLDVGTGSGYQAAVLSRLAGTVTSVEIIAPLARLAAWRLAHGGFANVSVHAGDAALQGFAPDSFDAIVVAAGAAKVPSALLNALKPAGRLVMPIGATPDQEIPMLVRKHTSGAVTRTNLRPARFVPLTGAGARPTAA